MNLKQGTFGPQVKYSVPVLQMHDINLDYSSGGENYYHAYSFTVTYQ